jgi:hypothetical protein
LSSVAGCQSLISEVLPPNLRDVAGTSDPKFTVALSEWQTRTGSLVVTPPYATIQKSWDAYLVIVLYYKSCSRYKMRLHG